MKQVMGKSSGIALLLVSAIAGAEVSYAGGLGERYIAIDAGTTENTEDTDLYYCECGIGDYTAERSDRAWGVRTGYRVTDKVALEAGYVDLGKTFDAVENPDGLDGVGEQKTKALTMAVVGSVALSQQAHAYAISLYTNQSSPNSLAI
jgi:hypothetical protein